MPTNTNPDLARIQRRLDRERKQAEVVISAMRDGAALHRQLGKQPRWFLSTGRAVADQIAQLVIFHHQVVGVGDSLFGPSLSQTFRWIDQ